jgi:hypothetical protein
MKHYEIYFNEILISNIFLMENIVQIKNLLVRTYDSLHLLNSDLELFEVIKKNESKEFNEEINCLNFKKYNKLNITYIINILKWIWFTSVCDYTEMQHFINFLKQNQNMIVNGYIIFSNYFSNEYKNKFNKFELEKIINDTYNNKVKDIFLLILELPQSFPEIINMIINDFCTIDKQTVICNNIYEEISNNIFTNNFMFKLYEFMEKDINSINFKKLINDYLLITFKNIKLVGPCIHSPELTNNIIIQTSNAKENKCIISIISIFLTVNIIQIDESYAIYFNNIFLSNIHFITDNKMNFYFMENYIVRSYNSLYLVNNNMELKNINDILYYKTNSILELHDAIENWKNKKLTPIKYELNHYNLISNVLKYWQQTQIAYDKANQGFTILENDRGILGSAFMQKFIVWSNKKSLNQIINITYKFIPIELFNIIADYYNIIIDDIIICCFCKKVIDFEPISSFALKFNDKSYFHRTCFTCCLNDTDKYANIIKTFIQEFKI